MPAGRPTKYKPEYVEQAKKLTQLGATDQQVASFFNVHVDTVFEWKARHPEFSEALKMGKAEMDAAVEQSLLRRALGYSLPAVKIMQHEGIPIEVPYTEHYPPDTTACIFWLKNRKPKEWRDRVEKEITGPNGGPVLGAMVDAPKQESVDEWITRKAKERSSVG